MNQDNPILNTINDVLGLGHAPKSFSEKMDGLRKSLNMPDAESFDLIRKDKNLTALEGSQIASSTKDVNILHQKLNKLGLIPASADTVFSSNLPGSFYFNPESRALFYGTRDRVTALPTVGPYGTINVGGHLRKVNSLLSSAGSQDYIDAYYASVGSKVSSGLGLHTAGKIEGPFKSSLMEGTFIRGIMTPEEGMWTSSRYAVSEGAMPEAFSLSLKKYRAANTAFTMLTATAGKSVYQGLQEFTDRVDYRVAFQAIRQYKGEYIKELGSLLTSIGGESSFLFTKPEFLGNKEKLLASSRALTPLFGSLFEESSAQKGLYQLAKMRRTSSSQIKSMLMAGQDPSAPYIVAGQSGEALYNQMKIRVGVVDTTNTAFSQMYFQEGGAILTEAGSRKFMIQAPMGSLKFKSPSDDLIGAVERMYGINLGAGYSQSVSSTGNFTINDFYAALNNVEDLSPIQKDIQTVLKASGRGRGVLKRVGMNPSMLSKIQLTDSTLSLDFSTPEGILPETIESVMGGRRFTNFMPGNKSPFSGMIPKEVLDNVDVFISSDEFSKMMGANVYLTNFIEKVRGRADAEHIFKTTFGKEAHLATKYNTKMIVPRITNHDEAFAQAQKMVQYWKSTKNDSLVKLANEVEHGTKVITSNLLNAGIKGISIFGMGGAVRTDFMGDINMLSPVRMTPSKMVTLASGSRALGYKSHYEDPLFGMFAEMSEPWRSKSIGVRVGSGQLFLSSQHLMKRFSRAMLGKPGYISPNSVIQLTEQGFTMGGKLLDKLPSMKSFSHSSGGVDFSKLSGTILGQANDMLYLDLGKERNLNLLGKGVDSRNYRYLPIPLKYLRTQQGIHNRLILGKTNPAYAFVDALSALENSGNFNSGFKSDSISDFTGRLQAGYSSVIKSIAGKDKLFSKTNTILMPLGTRARLVPNYSGGVTLSSFSDAADVFNSTISWSGFNDYLTSKSGMGKAVRNQISEIRRQVAKDGFFYAAIGVDPMQRAEHANVMKVKVDRNLRGTKGIGQLNLQMHPLWFRMTERDTDRDVANFIPLTGLDSRFTQKQLEERIAKQTAASKHALWFHRYEMMKSEGSAASQRLSNLKFVNAIDYLSTYLGVSKSLGYSATRSAETIMSNIAAYGVKGAKDLGVIQIGEEAISKIAAPYLSDPERLGAAQKVLQNLYQGGVAKGQSKRGLTEYIEEMVNLGQEYSGKNFDYEAVTARATEISREFLGSQKIRAFMDLDYLVKKGMIPSDTLSLMEKDLARGLDQTLDEAAERNMSKMAGAIYDAQAQILGEYLGPGMALRASSKRQAKGAIDVLRKHVSASTNAKELQDDILSPAAGIAPSMPKRSIGTKAEKVISEASDEIGESLISRASSYFNSSKGKTFGLGLGVGALVGAGLVSTMSEAPMPRDIDTRQPTDVGPDIFTTSPRIYGNNQYFNQATKQKSPGMIGGHGSYLFPNMSSSDITLRDRTSSVDLYALERHMRDISNSDYTY